MFEILLQSKPCNKCGEPKSLSSYNADRRNRDGKRGICKACEIKAVRAYELRNPGKVKPRDWKKHYAKHAERMREYAKSWWARNPDKAHARQRDRDALERGNGGKITAKEWSELKEKYNYTCLRCRRSEPEIKLTLDHVKPLAIGGGHSIRNAQPLCLSCNSSKGVKYIDYR